MSRLAYFFVIIFVSLSSSVHDRRQEISVIFCAIHTKDMIRYCVCVAITIFFFYYSLVLHFGPPTNLSSCCDDAKLYSAIIHVLSITDFNKWSQQVTDSNANPHRFLLISYADIYLFIYWSLPIEAGGHAMKRNWINSEISHHAQIRKISILCSWAFFLVCLFLDQILIQLKI